MKKLFAALSLCMLFSMVPGMEVLAETQISQNNESIVVKSTEITTPSDENSQLYFKEYKAMARWEWVAIFGVLAFFGTILMIVMFHLFWPYDNLMKTKAIAIPTAIVASLCLFGSMMFIGKTSDAEIMYKASMIKEISDAYAKDTGRLPIHGEFKGAGETNLLYAPDIEEMAKYRISVANTYLDGFYIEEETGRIYYKVGRGQKFVRPLES